MIMLMLHDVPRRSVRRNASKSVPTFTENNKRPTPARPKGNLMDDHLRSKARTDANE